MMGRVFKSVFLRLGFCFRARVFDHVPRCLAHGLHFAVEESAWRVVVEGEKG